MDAKAVERRGRDLSKAATANESSSTLSTILDDLRAGVKATEEILRSTKIGITVNRLKTHKDVAVVRQASELVAKWRRDVKGSPAAAHKGFNGSPKPTVNGTGNGAQKGERDEGGDVKLGSERSFAVAPELRNAKVDGVNTNQTGNDIRDGCIKLMYDGLAFMSEEPPKTILPLATAIELSAYTLLQPETSSDYKTKMRSLFMNLKLKSNPHLRASLLSRPDAADHLTPHRFVRMTAEELKSPERRAEDKQMAKENMDKAMVAQAELSVSSSLRCGKCGQRKVSYSQAQTRSADEPMTTFCECTVCGNRWKFS